MKSKVVIGHIPKEVQKIGKILISAGEEAYLVGGAVRDILANRSCTDFDLATTATPAKVAKLFAHVIPTGIQHGTVTILLGGQGYEVTTLRGDGAYSDGRRPDSIEYVNDINTDLARRDFTVNAMAWDMKQNCLHDPFGGMHDLKKRMIRAVGDPQVRFEEDALRALRAARFAATLGYGIEDQTKNAISPMSHRLAHISAERKQAELTKILVSEKPSIGLRVIEETGILPQLCSRWNVFATDENGRPDRSVWNVTVSRVDNVPPRLHLRLAGLLLHGYDFVNPVPPAKICQNWLRGMKFEKKIIRAVTQLVEGCSLGHFESWSDQTIRKFTSRVGRENAPDIIALCRSHLTGQTSSTHKLSALASLEKTLTDLLNSSTPLSVGELPLDGRTLIQELHLTPGPHIGQLLKNLLDEVLTDPTKNDKQTLLDIAQKTLDRSLS